MRRAFAEVIQRETLADALVESGPEAGAHSAAFSFDDETVTIGAAVSLPAGAGEATMRARIAVSIYSLSVNSSGRGPAVPGNSRMDA